MQTSYNGIPVSANGQLIKYKDGQYIVSDHPIVPFVESDGTGRYIWRASQHVFDAAVRRQAPTWPGRSCETRTTSTS